MRVMTVGSAGLLGGNVVSVAREQEHDVVGTYHTTEPSVGVSVSELDIRDDDRIRDLVGQYEPDVVVNCAAMTDVDACETDAETARAVNATAPGELAAVCADHGADVVHVSTDYVFDGDATEPYAETDGPRPVQTYGVTKLEGERAVRAAHPDPLILRLSFVYGVDRSAGELSGFPAWLRDRLRRGERTPLFTDQRVTPSRAGAVAETILAAVDADVTGLFHVASRSCVTPYEFGTRLCERLGASKSLLEEGSRAAVDRPAERPAYTCLDVSKIEARLDRPQPTLADDIDAVADVL
jgi:dTDP-4-dehydrorhamnose reductase